MTTSGLILGIWAYLAGAVSEFREDRVTRAEEFLLAPVEEQHLVDLLHDVRPVRDQDNGCPRRLGRADGCDQCLLALAVEVGIRLVQDQQCRVAVECPCQADPLALPARQDRARLTDLGGVALRQALDQFVDARHLRRPDDVVKDRRVQLREAADVLGHGTGEELDVLRQVADVVAPVLRRPLGDAHAVEQYAAAGRSPSTGQHAGQARLPGRARADQRHCLARPELEVDSPQDRFAALPGQHDVLDVEPTRRARQRQDLRGFRPLAGDGDKSLVSGPCADRRLPRADRLFDRGQGPAHQD